MLLFLGITLVFAFFKMNPRALDVVLSFTDGLRIRVTGDTSSKSTDSSLTVYSDSKFISILPSENNDWLIIPKIKGKDKKGNEATFEFYTLFGVNDDYFWAYESSDRIEDTSRKRLLNAENFFDEQFNQIGIKQRIVNALDVISVGVASCEGAKQKEEVRAKNRAKAIRRSIRTIATTVRGELPLLLLGQYQDEKCLQQNSDKTQDQRSIIIIGVVQKDPNVDLNEAVQNAMTNLSSSKELKLELEKYLKNPKRSPLGSLDPKRYSDFTLVN
jgi:hypothetical protein